MSKPEAPPSTHLIWLDLEMTGLDPARDRIIEIATVVTDNALNIVAQGPVIAIHQPESVIALMDDWNVKTHGASGLTQRVRDSQVSEAEAEQQTLAFIAQWTKPGESPMCGNSIYQDRRFIANYMPLLLQHFHYRNLDVSTLKELTRRWAPDIASQIKKAGAHTALADILESIAELRFYREHVMKI